MLYYRHARRRGLTGAQPSEDIVLTHSAEAAANTPAAGKAPAHSGAETRELGSDALLERILSSLDDNKAEEIVTIDLRGKSAMADHMVICSGRSSRQVSAISEKLVDRLKAETGRLCKMEGRETGDWVLIDCGDVLVHVFRPEVREFYQLEKMWQPVAAGQA